MLPRSWRSVSVTAGSKAMQYLVEGARGPLPPSPEQAIALLEGTVIPHFEHVLGLKAEGKILAGGVPVGDRAFVFIIEAASNDEADRIVRDMPAWGLLEWKVTPRLVPRWSGKWCRH